MKRALATLLLLASITGFGAALTAYAQFGAEPLMLSLQPAYPKPYDTVTIIPQSTLFSLAGAKVTVTAGGSVVTEGSGAEPAYVKLGGPGSVTTITVRAVTGGQTYTKSVTVRPADVSLIVESASTVPPFYEGGALVAGEGRIRLIALPDLRTTGGSVPAANLVYTWRNGDQILESASGIGKSVLVASAPVRYRDSRITVTVSTQDESVVAESSASISPSDPAIRVYRNDPLLGPLFGTALPQNITLSETEETFRAVPYFFPEKPTITWEVNGTPSDTDENITLRPSGSGEGTARLGVSAKAASSPRAAETTMNVRFGESRSLGIFGL